MGPITAAAIEAFAPPMASFMRGRDFAVWLGLVPRRHTTGGKPRLGRTSKMQRDIRRLLIIGAMTVVRSAVVVLKLYRNPEGYLAIDRMAANGMYCSDLNGACCSIPMEGPFSSP